MKFLELGNKTAVERIDARYIPPFHSLDLLNTYFDVVLYSEECCKTLAFTEHFRYYPPSVKVFRKFWRHRAFILAQK